MIDLKKTLVITGDFNSDIQKDKQYLHYMQEKFFSKEIVLPTHDSGSLLDHIYTNVGDAVADTIEVVWSDHKIVYAALTIL